VSPGRLETFADGVFAIAATLLILNVDTQVGEHEVDLGKRLLEIWPAYIGYIVSFVTIGIIWINHHTLIAQIGKVDRLFLLLNIGLLLCVAFIPFPTRLVTEHFRSDGARAAALVYGVTATAAAVFFSAIWFYASVGARLLRDDHDPRIVKGITRSYLPGPWIYLAATLVAFVSPTASIVLFGAIAVFYVLESSWFGRSRQKG
jgi:uncharacterized membrane protein